MSLLLPQNVSVDFFDVIVQATYNLQLVQTLLKLTVGLSRREKEALKAQYVQDQTERADTKDIKEDGNLGAAMGRVIANMENIRFFQVSRR